MKTALPLLTAILWMVCPAGVQARTWTDSTGKQTVEADLVGFNDGKALLKLPDGQVVPVAMDQLSRADRQYVREELNRRRAALKAEVSDRPGTVLYGPARELCKLASPVVAESSGLACSRRTPGLFWTHNDSGDAARIYAFDTTGKDLGSCLLGDVMAFDFEDIASFRLDKKDYLLVGDMGNNGRAATVQILYLIEEPPMDPGHAAADDAALDDAAPDRKAPVVQVINYAYEDDHRDCEALAVDPTSRTILLVTKQKQSGCWAYALAWPENDPRKVATARKIARLMIPPVTAMDVSPDGLRAVVSTYGNGYEYTRRAEEDWAAALARRPCEIVLPERIQGESICYGVDGKTLYLTSEKLPTPLWEVPVKQP